ncbi:hypothetical protein V8F06_013999 [Rhypophila decipiens]
MPQPYFTNTHFKGMKVGEVFTLTWDDAPSPVTIELMEGNPRTLRTVSVIADRVGVPPWNGHQPCTASTLSRYTTRKHTCPSIPPSFG